MSDARRMPPEMFRHYDLAMEEGRLSGRGRLEFERTCALIRRFAPSPPAVVYDVGGGPGAYAFWMAELGYEVHLMDAVELHIDQARERAETASAAPASFAVGDARDLDRDDDSVDVVLLMGPLYHLTERADRVRALAEARRVLRPGGVVLAAAISKFASALDGMARALLEDPSFVSIVDRDLRDGQHRNPDDHPDYFTTAYFHEPAAFAEEFVEAGFAHEGTFAIEGPAWLLPSALESDGALRERVASILERIESEPSLLGASAHWLGAGRVPE